GFPTDGGGDGGHRFARDEDEREGPQRSPGQREQRPRAGGAPQDRAGHRPPDDADDGRRNQRAEQQRQRRDPPEREERHGVDGRARRDDRDQDQEGPADLGGAIDHRPSSFRTSA